jgi:DNA-binding NarL/FixJ family response regulator
MRAILAAVPSEPPRTTDYREDELLDPGRPRLEILRPAAASRDLAPGSLLVGRDREADLRLDVSGVSRKHARLTVKEDGEVEVVDLGSKNGTFVNARRVDRASLREGDEVRFGEAVVRLLFVGRIEPPARMSPEPKVDRPAELSAREYEVACLVADGLTNAEIGKTLHISPATVGRHLSNIYERLSIHSRAALAKFVTKR